MKKIIIIGIIVIILILIGVVVVRTPAYKNVILITLDTTRVDALSCYGNENNATPHIDALADTGIRFTNAYALAPITLPSHSSMLLSKYPWNLKLFFNGDTVPQYDYSLQKKFKQLGFQTAAFTSLGVLKSFFGLSQNFDYYSDVSEIPARSYFFADEVNDNVFKWLTSHYEQPFLMWVHYSDPHEPYMPKDSPPDMEVLLNGESIGKYCINKRELMRLPVELNDGNNELTFIPLKDNSVKPIKDHSIEKLTIEDKHITIKQNLSGEVFSTPFKFDDAFSLILENPTGTIIKTDIILRGKVAQTLAEIRANYMKEVQQMDAAVGQLITELKEKKLFDTALIFMLADHGEGLSSHGAIGHESQVYLTQIHIPFIIVDHKHKGKVIQSMVSTVDIAPTIFAYLGKKPDSNWEGRNLIPLLDNPAHPSSLPSISSSAYFYTSPNPEGLRKKFSLVLPPYHLIYTPHLKRYELYNMHNDEKEQINLVYQASTPINEYPALVQQLKNYQYHVKQQFKFYKAPKLPADEVEKLRSLGYVNP